MKNRNIIIICLILAAGFVYLTASQISDVVFDRLSVPLTREYYLTWSEMIGLGVAVLCFLITVSSKRFMTFANESVIELTKVVYPTRKETGQAAIVVVGIVVVATVALSLIDWVWSGVTQAILN